MRRRISDACQHSCLIILDQLKVFQGLFVCLFVVFVEQPDKVDNKTPV